MLDRNSFANDLGLNAYQSAYQISNQKGFAGNLGLDVHQNTTYLSNDSDCPSESKLVQLEADNHVQNLADRRRTAYSSNYASAVNQMRK